jgi:hypothetical protein
MLGFKTFLFLVSIWKILLIVAVILKSYKPKIVNQTSLIPNCFIGQVATAT